MKFHRLSIPDVLLIEADCIVDERGFFSETFREDKFAEQAIHVHFIQENRSLSGQAGTLRGLHFQAPPRAQDKLVRVIQGSILDVAVDIREGSPTFGRSVSVEISKQNELQIFVPKGFAHGFVTLEPNTEVLYKTSNYFAPDCDRGIFWNDPDLAIDWKLNSEPILSARDRIMPLFLDLPKGLFPYDRL
ncbi:MAG: dTDP-4-dehydrorhamnose 3,5-epimerase [Verrucomicrobia bacterium]|nr:MAG: dTDP-4-dehydrorhamnose 3,5-epimerase [Alphaproteobacteria bacterium]TAG08709.1 MAG: dTDP-4-dehydrorhamnose 3,5-epimerase [Verrucomicrobiota bacterium]